MSTAVPKRAPGPPFISKFPPFLMKTFRSFKINHQKVRFEKNLSAAYISEECTLGSVIIYRLRGEGERVGGF